MKNAARIRRDSLPITIIRHLEQQGLGWGHDLEPGAFWIKTTGKKER